MIKVISVLMDGKIEDLLKYWSVPENISSERKGETRLKITFIGDVDEFYRMERIVQQNNIPIKIMPIFRVQSFTDDDLLYANLLSFTGPTDEHIEVVRSEQSDDVIMRLIRHLGDTPLRRIFFPYNSPVIFHKDIIDDLNVLGLNKGAVIKPCSVEDQGRISSDWFALTSSVDLGEPDLDRRFLTAFPRDRWRNEDFCYSSVYVPEILYISQPVYRYLRSMPDYQQLQLHIRPTDLI